MLKGKARRAQNWLPNQVAYGIDTSDADPEKWVPFGDMAETASEEPAPSEGALAGKGRQPTTPAK